MIAFIDQYRDHYSVEFLCRVLSEHLEGGFITPRGYRAAKSRPASTRSIRDQILIEELKSIHAENYGGYVSSGTQLGVPAGILAVTR